MITIANIENRSAVIGVIGLGYVGLPLAFAFARGGFRVVGFDIDHKKIAQLEERRSYICYLPDASVVEAFERGFTPTADFNQINQCDAIIICVPTPLTKHRDPDLSYVANTGKAIVPRLRLGQLIILESTTYPGTTDGVLRPILEKSGLKAGKDFHLAFSPEREDPSNKEYTTTTIPKVVGGIDEQSLALADALYRQIVVSTVPVSSAATAEAVKILENTYRAVNIALVNELKVVFTAMGIDIWEVIQAAATKPFGFTPFYPGPGLGGHCIPIDPFYLSWKAKEYELSTRFIELAGEINTFMPHYVVERVASGLNERERSLKGSKILICGVAYKRDVDDLRESPALKIIELLEQAGSEVHYHDPFIPTLRETRKYKKHKKSEPLTAETLSRFDAAIITTDHTGVNYELLVENVPLVFDTRNATKHLAKQSNVIKT